MGRQFNQWSHSMLTQSTSHHHHHHHHWRQQQQQWHHGPGAIQPNQSTPTVVAVQTIWNPISSINKSEISNSRCGPDGPELSTSSNSRTDDDVFYHEWNQTRNINIFGCGIYIGGDLHLNFKAASHRGQTRIFEVQGSVNWWWVFKPMLENIQYYY